MRSRIFKALSMLAAVFTLVAVSAAPANAANGYYWATNRTGGCLDFSGQFGFRVFPCNGDRRYQYLSYYRPFSMNPDIYQIGGNPASGRPDTCIHVNGSGRGVYSNPCQYLNAQHFTIRYANGWAYFDSLLLPGYCLTKSFLPHNGGSVLTTEPCAGRLEQYWTFTQ